MNKGLSEKQVLEKFKDCVKKGVLHKILNIASSKTLSVKEEVPVGPLIADLRVDQLGEDGYVEAVICYGEVKGDNVDIRDLLGTAQGQALTYCNVTGKNTLIILSHQTAVKFQEALENIHLDPRIKIFDVEAEKLIEPTKPKKTDKTELFVEWSKSFEIETLTPIALQNIEKYLRKDEVYFNLGSRIRGCLKEILRTVSPTLAESIKYTTSVTPPEIVICKKEELQYLEDTVPLAGKKTTVRRQLALIPPPRKISFTINCLVRSGKFELTPEIVTEALRRAGRFTGIGDAHSNGYYGRFRLIE